MRTIRIYFSELVYLFILFSTCQTKNFFPITYIQWTYNLIACDFIKLKT